MVIKRGAVRAVNIPMIQIDTEFRDASFYDIPGVLGSKIQIKKIRGLKKKIENMKKVERSKNWSGIVEKR